jgi:hypothetical protein
MTQRWFPMAFAVAVAYAAVGLITSAPGHFGRPHFLAWRLGAWALSAIVFALHLGYEAWRVRSTAVAMALHASIAVALGAFGLAAGAAIRSGHPRTFLLALIVWPLVLFVPAFLVAFVLALGITARRGSRGTNDRRTST